MHNFQYNLTGIHTYNKIFNPILVRVCPQRRSDFYAMRGLFTNADKRNGNAVCENILRMWSTVVVRG